MDKRQPAAVAKTGEILALKWRDLNLKTGELHISRQVLKVNGKVLISTPKTKSSNRMILLPPEMTELLAELKTRTDSEWIFPSPLDLTQPRHPSAVYHRFQKILERANCKRVRFHDLRHHAGGVRGEAGRADKNDESGNCNRKEKGKTGIAKGRPRTVALQYWGCGRQRKNTQIINVIRTRK